MSDSMPWLLLVCLFCLGTSSLPAGINDVVPPDTVDRPGELTVARMEASIYSLPYMEARVDFKIEEEGVLVSQSVKPVLRFPWKVVDHSRGLNLSSALTLKLFRDAAFRSGEQERWEEVETIRKTVANRANRNAQSRFDRQNVIDVPTNLSYLQPVERYRVVINCTVRSSMHAEKTTKERIFYLCLKPQWKGAYHQHGAMMKMLLLAFRRKQSLIRWKSYCVSAALANRSIRDARTFGKERILEILSDTRKIAKREPGDSEIEELAFDLMNESGRILGRPTEKINAVNREILGVSRIGFSNYERLEQLHANAGDLLGGVSYPRNFLVGFLKMEEKAEVVDRIERITFFINEVSRALRHLWFVKNSSELAVLLGKLKKSLDLEASETAALARRIGRLTGRRGSSPHWDKIEKTILFNKIYPDNTLGNKKAVCSVIRSLYQGLFSLLLTNLYHVRILSQATARSIEPYELEAPRILLKPPIRNEILPPKLSVSVPLSGQAIRPGQVVSYPITCRNLHHQPREVKLVELRKLPSGWFSKISRASLLLQPGEQKTINYVITAPYYTAQTMTARSSVRIFFTEDPARFHEPVFQTRCLVDSDRSVQGNSRFNKLDVTVPRDKQTIKPGAVASYTFMVRHDGPAKKLVKCDVVSDIPDKWIVETIPQRLYLAPGRPEKVTVKITAPLYMKKTQTMELILGIGYADDFEHLEKISLSTLVTNLEVLQAMPLLNDDETRTYLVPRRESTTVHIDIANRGSAADTFDLFPAPPPKGWYIGLAKKTVSLAPGASTRIPVTVRADGNARAGEYERVRLTAISVTHPEIRTDTDLVFSIVDDKELEVTALQKRYRVAPGDSADISLKVVNHSETASTVGFKPSRKAERSTWLNIYGKLSSIAPGATRMVFGKLRVPSNEKPGQVIPFSVATVNARGDEIGESHFELAICRRHNVDIVLSNEHTTRSRGLVTCRLLVTNTGTVRDAFALIPRGGTRRWMVKLSLRRIELAAGETGFATLIVKIPPRSSDRKPISVEIEAKSIADSSARDFVRVDVTP